MLNDFFEQKLQEGIILHILKPQQTSFPENIFPLQAEVQNILLITVQTTTIRASCFTYPSPEPLATLPFYRPKAGLMWNYQALDQTASTWVKMAFKATSAFPTLSDAFPFSMSGGTIYVQDLLWVTVTEIKNQQIQHRKGLQHQFSEGRAAVYWNWNCYWNMVINTKCCGFEKSNHQPQSKNTLISFIQLFLVSVPFGYSTKSCFSLWSLAKGVQWPSYTKHCPRHAQYERKLASSNQQGSSLML